MWRQGNYGVRGEGVRGECGIRDGMWGMQRHNVSSALGTKVLHHLRVPCQQHLKGPEGPDCFSMGFGLIEAQKTILLLLDIDHQIKLIRRRMALTLFGWTPVQVYDSTRILGQGTAGRRLDS